MHYIFEISPSLVFAWIQFACLRFVFIPRLKWLYLFWLPCKPARSLSNDDDKADWRQCSKLLKPGKNKCFGPRNYLCFVNPGVCKMSSKQPGMASIDFSGIISGACNVYTWNYTASDARFILHKTAYHISIFHSKITLCKRFMIWVNMHHLCLIWDANT